MPTIPTPSFVLPADGRLTGRFGVRRFFNGEPRSPHAGFDIAAARGSPVKANAEGIVLASDDYFFNGKTVFVDHGNGLISMYCHLDRIDVQPGEAVSKGQRLGLVRNDRPRYRSPPALERDSQRRHGRSAAVYSPGEPRRADPAYWSPGKHPHGCQSSPEISFPPSKNEFLLERGRALCHISDTKGSSTSLNLRPGSVIPLRPAVAVGFGEPASFPQDHQQGEDMKHVIWVLWPAFIAAGIAEVLFLHDDRSGAVIPVRRTCRMVGDGHLLDGLLCSSG
jgi:hypothetical protein